MERCVIYFMTPDEVRTVLGPAPPPKPHEVTSLLSGNLWEVWQGLPKEYHFSEVVRTASGQALCVAQPGVYIWVWPTAYETVLREPLRPLIAYGRRSTSKIEFRSVDVLSNAVSTEEVIARAKELNAKAVREGLERLRTTQ